MALFVNAVGNKESSLEISIPLMLSANQQSTLISNKTMHRDCTHHSQIVEWQFKAEIMFTVVILRIWLANTETSR